MTDSVDSSLAASTARTKASAPYGQACTNCVKSKCRCILRDGGTCERCSRLSKECILSSSTRKKGIRKQSQPSRRSQLEDRLDDLVKLLHTQSAPRADRHPSAAPHLETPCSSTPSPQSATVFASGGDSLTDAELAYFRKNHLPQFPFINLPPTLTATQLRAEKPMLCMALKTICTKSHYEQARMSARFREQIASRLLVDGERSMDLLLSVLASLAWLVYFTFAKQFLVMLSGLARILVIDLRLDKPQCPSWCPSAGPPVHTPSSRSNEVRRAVIACFALNTIICATSKSDLVSWISQLEDDCHNLSENNESPSDMILVTIARICKNCVLALEINRHYHERLEYADQVGTHIAPLLSGLHYLRSTLTETQSKHDTIAGYVYINEISIYELALFQTRVAVSRRNSFSSAKRAEYLMSLLQACKAATEHFLSLDLIHVPISSMSVFSYCTKILYSLSVFQDPSWDPGLVPTTVDLPGLFERCAAVADNSNAQIKAETGEDSVFVITAKALREMIPNWRVSKREPQPEDLINPVPWGADQAINMPSDSFLDFSDDFWMNAQLNI